MSFARNLFSEDLENYECPICRRICEGDHPDQLIRFDSRADIPVDRDIYEDLALPNGEIRRLHRFAPGDLVTPEEAEEFGIGKTTTEDRLAQEADMLRPTEDKSLDGAVEREDKGEGPGRPAPKGCFAEPACEADETDEPAP